MRHDLQDTEAILARTPGALDALLRGLPDTWTRHNEGGDTWDVRDIIGHLIHGDRTDWIPRAKRVLQSGESVPFEAFDMGGHARETEGKSIAQLLDDFARVRSENLRELRALNLGPADLERRGRHPSLGSVTLAQLLDTWAAHDLTHLHQISRVMAYQYRDAVGPWKAYLGVLQCAGHSAV
jgi:hypothetical protein